VNRSVGTYNEKKAAWNRYVAPVCWNVGAWNSKRSNAAAEGCQNNKVTLFYKTIDKTGPSDSKVPPKTSPKVLQNPLKRPHSSPRDLQMESLGLYFYNVSYISYGMGA
jgi:hypothetical protein